MFLFSRVKRCGLCRAQQPSVSQLIENADDKLYQRVRNDQMHRFTLYKLLPDRQELSCTLRPKKYDITLKRIFSLQLYYSRKFIVGWRLKNID